MSVQRIVDVLSACRFSLSNEKQTQREIAEALLTGGIEARREVNLGDGDIPDFMVGDIAIEVKLRASSKMEIFRQLNRYAQHDEVASLLLVTNRAMGLPPLIADKPVYYLSLGRAWL